MTSYVRIAGKNSDPLRYDDSYGGVVSTNGVNDPYADFGNGWYNDHVSFASCKASSAHVSL